MIEESLDLKKDDSDDTKKISHDLLENSNKLDSKLSDPKEIAKFPKWDTTLSQYKEEKKKFEQILQDPSLYNEKWELTKGGAKEIEVAYNELIKAYNKVQGIIEWSAGKNSQNSLENNQKDQQEKNKDLLDFSESIKKMWESREQAQKEWVERASKKAREISQWSQSIANTHPEIVAEWPSDWPADAF